MDHQRAWRDPRNIDSRCGFFADRSHQDFFAAADHPSIVADLTSATRTGDQVAVQGTLTVAGVTRPLSFTATLADVTAAAFTLRAEGVVVDRADFGLTWNQLGMLTGASTVDVEARFIRS